ncbi:MAG: hypothetical protein K2K02_08295, partial [Ruminococcus sp.]|nr:hypothetical protein [Ruminococcus sp.]
MSFRDYKSRQSDKNKIRPYISGISFRDMNFKSVKKISDEKESQTVPDIAEKNVIPNIPPQPASQYQNSVYIQQPVSQYQNSVYIQQPSPVVNPNIPQSVPLQNNQSQFLYYNQNPVSPQTPPPVPTVQKSFIPVPPQQPPEKPDPSKFIEEYVPTPPPKMVRAKVPKFIKKENKNTDFGGFGGTFDGDPDQSTPIADIPVMFLTGKGDRESVQKVMALK